MPARCLVVAVVFVSLLAAPAGLGAQQSSARDTAISRLKTGQQIRLSAAGSGRLTGQAGVAMADTLDLAQDGSSLCEYDCSDDDTGAILAGGVIGAALVGGLGAVVGSAIPKWRRQCP
jgi:hypothetical protein